MRHNPAPGMAPGFTLGAPSAPLPCPFLHLLPHGEVVAPEQRYHIPDPQGRRRSGLNLSLVFVFSCLAVTWLPKAPIFQVSWEIKDSACPSLTSQPFDILGARSWGHKGPPSSTLARPIWRRGGNRMSPKFGKVSKGLGKGSGGCRQGRKGSTTC